MILTQPGVMPSGGVFHPGWIRLLTVFPEEIFRFA
jgi:hypothetical protein